MLASDLHTAADVDISDSLHRRLPADPDYLREKLAILDLARQMADHPKEVLPRLVGLAMEICDGASAGVSILEPDHARFRWYGLKGVLSAFEGSTTPRDDSPCGVCLDRSAPILMERPERVYRWIADANIVVPEVLLVPLATKGLASIGTLWVVADRVGHFNEGHARILTELSTFAGMALRMIQTEERLQLALQEQETLTREMGHRVKNLFALTNGLIRVTSRGVETKEQLVTKLTGRMQALADANALVRRSFSDASPERVDFSELLSRILRPHDDGESLIVGPRLAVGERATNNLALIFHELATNAAKYGALSVESGSVAVEWVADDRDVRLQWRETGGPATNTPLGVGFGTRLIAMTVQGFGGTITYDWRPEGLVVHLQIPRSALAA
jgi:two-component sensor histidine kinase